MYFQERLDDDLEQWGDDWRDSRQHGETATGAVSMSTPSCSSCGGAPNQATESPIEGYPQGCPRGGEDEHPRITDFLKRDISNGLSTTRVTCLCGKSCKNLRGLKILQTKMGCRRRKQADQHTEAVLSTVLGETEEEPYLESPTVSRTSKFSMLHLASHPNIESNSIGVRKAYEEPVEDLRCLSERHSSDPVNAHRAENLAISSGQVRPSGKVQGLDI